MRPVVGAPSCGLVFFLLFLSPGSPSSPPCLSNSKARKPLCRGAQNPRGHAELTPGPSTATPFSPFAFFPLFGDFFTYTHTHTPKTDGSLNARSCNHRNHNKYVIKLKATLLGKDLSSEIHPRGPLTQFWLYPDSPRVLMLPASLVGALLQPGHPRGQCCRPVPCNTV